MKGKRYTTEEKIRILRQADRGKSIQEVCRENNVSEQTFHRWKREFGMIDVNQAKRMKELEKENVRLKRMLADKMLGIEILQRPSKKNCKPWAQAASGRETCGPGPVFDACSVPILSPAPLHLCVSVRSIRMPGKRN